MINMIISYVFSRTFFNLVFLAVLLISVTVTGSGFCGELRNYDLPSQEQRPYREFQQMPPRYPEDRGVYTQFRQEVRRLNPAQRRELREIFNKTLQKTTDQREREHYIKLISILEECGTGQN